MAILSYVIAFGFGLVLSACSSSQDEPEPTSNGNPEDPVDNYQVDEDAQALWQKLTQAGVPPNWIDRGTHYLSYYPKQDLPSVSKKNDRHISLDEIYGSVNDLIWDSNSPGFTPYGDQYKKIEEEILAKPETRIAYGLALVNHPEGKTLGASIAGGIFREAIKDYPDRPDLHWKMGYYYHVTDFHGLAMGAYMKAFALEPKKYLSAVEGFLSRAHHKGGMTSVCLEIWDFTRENPESPWGFYFLGKAAKLDGDFRAAKEALEKTLQLDPSHEQARRTLAEVLSGASAHYRREIFESPQSSRAYFRLAELLEQRGGSNRLEEARKLRLKADELEHLEDLEWIEWIQEDLERIQDGPTE